MESEITRAADELRKEAEGHKRAARSGEDSATKQTERQSAKEMNREADAIENDLA